MADSEYSPKFAPFFSFVSALHRVFIRCELRLTRCHRRGLPLQ